MSCAGFEIENKLTFLSPTANRDTFFKCLLAVFLKSKSHIHSAKYKLFNE